MNTTSIIKSNIKASCKVNKDTDCENTATATHTLNQRLANISNKLGLSKAIYQK